MAEKLYLSPDEVVERLNKVISKKTLANWRSASEGPPFAKLGGRILYPIAQFEEWERARQFGSTKEYRGARAAA